MPQEIRRGPGTGCRADVQLGLEYAQLAGQPHQGLDILEKLLAAELVVAGAHAVELEEVHPVGAYHFGADFVKPLVVLRAGEGESVPVDLESLFNAILQPLLARFAVASKRRQPDAQRGAATSSRLEERRETLRETVVKLPERGVVVPAVIEHEAVHRHAALGRQLAAERLDGGDGLSLVEFAIGPGNVIPRVVVKKRAVGMGALALDVIQVGAAQLAGRRDAHDRR